MKIRTELSCFLGRKKINLESFCKNYGVSTYEELCGLLDDLSVVYPKRSDTEFLNKRKSAKTPDLKKETKPKLEKKSKPLPTKKKQYTKKST